MKRILVVDDEAVLRDLIAARFPAHHFLVDRACNGRQALALAGNTRYDLIISDILMPEMDGLTLVKHLRQQGNQVPIIVASSAPCGAHHFEGLGVIGPIHKPDIDKTLEAWLREIYIELKSSP